MNPATIKDLTSTAAGGAGGYGLLLSVKWELVPHGECVKLGAALLLIVLGYLAYRGGDGGAGA